VALTRSNLEGEVGRFLGWGRSGATGSAADDIDAIVDRGLRQFYYPGVLPNEAAVHEWSFLKPVATIVTNGPYSTGTIEVVSGVVTLTTGTFPSWAAEGTLSVANEDYDIATRDSGSQITLVDTSVNISSGTSYVLRHDELALPADFGGIAGPMTYSRESQEHEIRIVGESYIRVLRQDQGQIDDAPVYAAVRPIAGSTYGNSFELLLWPSPDKSYRIQYKYNVEVTASSTIYGGTMHDETIMASCLAIAELYAPEKSNRHRELYQDRLAASVMLDRQATAIEYFGQNLDNSDEPVLIRRNLRYATYTNNSGTVYPS